MGKVVAFTHCHRGIGEDVTQLTPSIRPLPNTENSVILCTIITELFVTCESANQTCLLPDTNSQNTHVISKLLSFNI